MTELEQLTEIIRQELKTELASARKNDGPDLTTQKPEPIVINVGGQPYTFETKEEMEAALNQTFQTFRSELEKAKTPQTEDRGSYVSGKENTGEQFDQNKYIELMGKDALEAQKYIQDHIYGIPDSSNFIKNQLQEAATLKATVSAYQFREIHPEFPMTPEATKIVDGIRRELNQPFTLSGLEAAYGVAQSRGLIPSPQLLAYQRDLIAKGIVPDPAAQQDQTQQQQNFTRPNPSGLGFQPPPAVGRTTTVPGADVVQIAENMSLEQLEAALRRAGQL